MHKFEYKLCIISVSLTLEAVALLFLLGSFSLLVDVATSLGDFLLYTINLDLSSSDFPRMYNL